MPKFNPNRDGMTYLCGGGFDESLIKLSISHENLDPSKITAALHLRPTKSYRKGDLSENKKRIMHHGMWQLATPWIAKWDFEANITRFLRRLPLERRLWRTMTARYKCDLTAVLRMRTFNRGAHIPPDILRQIADRGLKLGLDVYFDDDDRLWSEKKG